jgi:hypothetical protein
VPRIFLLSPAKVGGIRAGYVLREGAAFPLAVRLRETGVPIGEVMSFMSGLYFRGKYAYARAFAQPPWGHAGAFVVTSNRGLWPADETVTARELRSFADGDIDADDPGYRRPLLADVRRLARTDAEFVLLGSIATGKYIDVLTEVLGDRLLFPSDFVGRGDMSRGGLLLRCVQEGSELSYAPVLGAVRHGVRPAKLAPPQRRRRTGGKPLAPG